MSNEFAKVAASLLFEMDKENFSKMAANDPDMIRYLYPDQWVKFAAFVPGSLLKYVKPLAPEGIPLKKILRNVAQDIRVPKPAFATKKGFADSLARYGKEFMLSNDKIINKSLAKATPLRERASFKAMYNTKDKLHNFEGRVSKDLKTKALLESKGVNSISELSMDELFNLANAGGSGGATGAIL